MYLVKSHHTRIDGKFTHLHPGDQYNPSAWELRAYPDRFSEQPPEQDSKPEPSEPDIEKYTTRQLTRIAQDNNVSGYSGLRKLFALVKDYL